MGFRVAGAALVLAALACADSGVPTAPTGVVLSEGSIPGKYNVILQNTEDPGPTCKAYGARVVRKVFRGCVGAAMSGARAVALSRHPRVRLVEPDGIVRANDSRYVHPTLAFHYSRNRSRADRIFSRQAAEAFAIGMSATDLFDSHVGELGVGAFFTARWPSTGSALLLHVGDVVGLRSKKEMGWIATGRVVASMADIHSFWDSAISGLPGHSVRKGKPLPPLASLDHSVAGGIHTGLPRPAFVATTPLHFLVEAGEQRTALPALLATFPATANGAVRLPESVRPNTEWLTASRANHFEGRDALVHAVNIRALTDVVQLNVPPWSLDRIDQRALPLDGVASFSRTGAGTTIFVVDTGIDFTHPEFEGRASLGVDLLGGNGTDCNGHGTHVAGTTGGKTYGVARQVRLKAVRVLNCQGSGLWSDVVLALDWIAQNRSGPSVVNMSLGGNRSEAVNTAIESLTAHGVLSITAAGNEGTDACLTSPTSAPSAFGVGATDATDTKPSWSNYGACVDGFAPGVGVTSSIPGGGSATWSGTSMASPHVAGIAALYLEECPSCTPAQVDAALRARFTKAVVQNARSANYHLAYSGTDADNTPIPPTQPIAAPSGFTATVGGERFELGGSPPVTSIVTLRWTDNSGNESGFEIWRDGSLSPSWYVPANATVLAVHGFLQSSTVTLKVRAFGGDGGFSDFASVTFTLPPALTQAPAQPTEFMAVLDRVIDANWVFARFSWKDNATNEAGFEIRGYKDGIHGFSGSLQANQTFSTAAIPVGGWVLEIAAINSAGYSGWTRTTACFGDCTPTEPPPEEPPPPEPEPEPDPEPPPPPPDDCPSGKRNPNGKCVGKR